MGCCGCKHKNAFTVGVKQRHVQSATQGHHPVMGCCGLQHVVLAGHSQLQAEQLLWWWTGRLLLQILQDSTVFHAVQDKYCFLQGCALLVCYNFLRMSSV